MCGRSVGAGARCLCLGECRRKVGGGARKHSSVEVAWIVWGDSGDVDRRVGDDAHEVPGPPFLEVEHAEGWGAIGGHVDGGGGRALDDDGDAVADCTSVGVGRVVKVHTAWDGAGAATVGDG